MNEQDTPWNHFELLNSDEGGVKGCPLGLEYLAENVSAPPRIIAREDKEDSRPIYPVCFSAILNAPQILTANNFNWDAANGERLLPGGQSRGGRPEGIRGSFW